MLANGAACCIGDQLHPRGQLSQPVYDLIGRVYAQVEAKEPWCAGAQPLAEVAVYNVEAAGVEDGRVDTSNAGALRMLLEEHVQFDFVDERADWTKYRVLVFPDKVPFDAALAERVRAYLNAGGKVIASYRSGLDPEGTHMALAEFGVHPVGETSQWPDYVHPEPALQADLEDTDYVMYERGLAVEPAPGALVLARTIGPDFERRWDHFCSHRQTPPDPEKTLPYPAMVRNAQGNVIYMAHPVFAGYRRQAPLWYKRLFVAALNLLMPDRLVVTDAPSTAQLTLTRQSEPDRTVVHILHYIPERRGLEFDTIEDVIPLYDVQVDVRTAVSPARVYLAPSREPLPLSFADGYAHLAVPRVLGHAMVVLETERDAPDVTGSQETS